MSGPIAEIVKNVHPIDLVSRIKGLYSYDIETTDLQPRNGDITDCGFCWREGGRLHATSFSWDREVQDLLFALEAMTGVFASNQNGKFDLRWRLEKLHLGEGLKLNDPRIKNMLEHYKLDTLFAEHLLAAEGRKSLDILIERHRVLNTEDPFLEWYRKMKAMRSDMSQMTDEEKDRYVCFDTEAVLRVLPKQKEKADKTNNRVFEQLQNLEIPLMRVLLLMEQAGIWIDQDYLYKAEADLLKRKEEVALEAKSFAPEGMDWNIASPTQTRVVLFDHLGMKPLLYTDGGKSGNVQPSTSKEAMALLAEKNDHPIFKPLIEHSRIAKLLGTYINQIKTTIYPDGKVRTNWNQSGEIKGGTASGRLTSDNPSLQVLPKGASAHDLYQPRQALYSPYEDLFLLAVDADQLELRWVAWEAQEPSMLTELTRPGGDIHRAMAARLYKKPFDEVTSSERKVAKTANFGISYGVEKKAFVQQIYQQSGIKMQLEEADKIIKTVRAEYSAVEAMKKKVVNKAIQNGYVENYLGRRRYCPNITSSDWFKSLMDQRAAFNHIIQAGGSDFIKHIMVKVSSFCDWSMETWWPVMAVHDEIVFYVYRDQIDNLMEAIDQAKREVPLPYGAVPEYFPLSAKIGRNYNQMESLSEWKEKQKHLEKVLH